MQTVLVVGAGPVGLVMAAELARHGIRCRIIDTLSQPSPHCRALGITTRTLEVFEDMGILTEVIDRGIWIRGRRIAIGGNPAGDFEENLNDFPYAHTTLSIPQPLTERILTRHLASFGITVERGVTLKTLKPSDECVRVQLEQADGEMEESVFSYVIGCDGAHSAVRKSAGIEFEGEMMPYEFMLADVHIDWELPAGYSFQSIYPASNTAPEFFVAIPLPQPGRYRVSMLAPTKPGSNQKGTDHGIQSERESPCLELLQQKADQLVGDPVQLSDLRWSSIFRISMRLARSYQAGNVFLAGDAAHIHPPTGGQGMNTGIQDAYNLAWKMALVLKGRSPQSLLESYTAERREEGQKVIERTISASLNTGAGGFKTDRLADSQISVSYRNSRWVTANSGEFTSDLQPGDRAPDCLSLRRQGVGYTFRLFELLKGTEHVLLIDLASPTQAIVYNLYQLVHMLTYNYGEDIFQYLKIVAISSKGEDTLYIPHIIWAWDPDGEFARAFGSLYEASWLIRPDGYVSWFGMNYDYRDLILHLQKIFKKIRK